MTKRPANQSNSLCWRCRRSCVDKCSWAEDGTPVDGWDAIRNDIRIYGQRDSESYIVRHCPLYDDRPFSRDPKDIDYDGCVALLEQAARIARKDYIYNVRERHSIEEWLEGMPGMIAELRQAAAEADAVGRRDKLEKRKI